MVSCGLGFWFFGSWFFGGRGADGFWLWFVAGDYERAIESSNSAAAITSVLYPNDHTTCKLSSRILHFGADSLVVGKELRLKQQYFWTAASLADIMRRFKNTDKPITEFPDCACSTHVSLLNVTKYLEQTLRSS